ncbi:hypothetical protein K469DRAFT_550471 [Zopfia rhizophila CBS 207.26]|uniref:D-lactate dehydrogenase (cytochrome) n=1 Tax=Zopfia rhizophila CBS 207.26 TaxID=1314779 RepID=A0A6A6EUE2_9PEZI|nr:hypothetical protein K469DRAFT_550471 [Zopfia rhizophila CBS 207.26]
MHRHTRSEAGDLSSPRSSRAPSFSSDRPSLAGSVTFQMPSSVRPPPAYIAASVASQIVTDHHNAQLQEEFESDEDPSAFLVNALFSEQALCLLNIFLDHLLFSFLSTARSPSLTAVRPAITEVLKPRLAREAMATADEELQGLLAGEEDEEFPASQNGQKATEKWDIEKVWKRTRLRIMVYTRLGELEDEDEERYVQQERGLSMDDGDDDEAELVSWASAIFLTSVIEYIAEQTLMVSGQAAFARMSAKMKKNARASADEEDHHFERLIVEDFDVEKLALNSALGRLWRTWRKRVRSPITPLTPSRVRAPRSISSLISHRRQRSHDTADDSILSGDASMVPEVLEHKITETDIAANIPLPISDNDVAEIEVPGLARQLDDESSGTQTPIARPQRPSSFIMLAPAESFRKRLARERPVSMPPPEPLPFTVPPSQSVTDESDSVTTMERMSEDHSHIEDDHHSYIEEERQEIEDNRQDEKYHEEHNEAEADADMVAFAASTGMGFGMSPTSPTKPGTFGKNDDDATDTPTKTGYDSEPQVLQSKRMSIEKAGHPDVVRTFSVRSNRSSHGIQATEGSSYLDDTHTDEELDNREAIGVARTTNVPIPATPSPPAELPTNGQSTGYMKQLDHGVVDQDATRHLAPAQPAARRTPSPVDKPFPPEKSVQRKDVTPPRTTSTSSRGPALASLQEAEHWTNKHQESAVHEKKINDTQRGPTQGSPKHSGSRRSRELPVPVAERSAKRQSVESTSRSRTGTADGVERSTLKRVSSSSSTNKSISTSILHSARESDSSLGRPRGLSGRMSEEDREREFDSLVKGEETVKYTLTPQSMRDLDVEPPKATSSVTVYPRVNADKDNSFGSQPIPARTASRSNGPSTSANKRTGPKPLAREPRIQTESMQDFADFIRSTGPSNKDTCPVQPFVPLSGSASKSPPSSSSAISGLDRKLSARQSSTPTQSTSGAGEGPSARPRIHMEPRSPAGQRSGNDELIDFIRQGPPGSNNGQHRIPRTVAPFRTTVDSDQFDRMLDDHGNVESAYSSQMSTNSKQSTHTDTNSRTGLLPAPNVVQPAYSNTPQSLTGSLSASEPQIQRTRRRVKDPYAIDSDDEDEDLLTALPKSSRRQEESLADFLNNFEPPPGNEPKPILTNGALAAAAKARSSNNNAILHASSSSSTPAVSNRNAPVRLSVQPAIISSSITSEAPRAHKPKLQARAAGARDARAGRSATNDLADFLRTSGPPEPAAPPPGATMRKEEGKRLNTKFWPKANEVPLAVFYPQTTAEVSAIATACHERNIAITLFSGGTSLGGALAATRGGICIDFKRMDQIVELHEDDMDVVVQPNIGWVELNAFLEKKKLFFPPDPAPGARIGGMIAMGCSGTNAYRYGTMKDWVISLTVVLADGTIVKTRHRPRKSSAGYDLTNLIVGSEGTLALVTEAVLKVTALPQNLHVGMIAFETTQAGVDVAVKILRSGYLLEAIELADRPSAQAINHSGLAQVQLSENPALFLKFAGSQQTVLSQVSFVQELCTKHNSLSLEISSEKGRIDVIWGARKYLGNALVRMKKNPDDLFLHTDAAVPISKMAQLVDQSERIVGGSGWFSASVGHIGDGNVHTAIVCPKEDKEDAEKLLAKVQRLALKLEGTITGEHGVGLKLRDMLVEEVGQEGLDAMRKIKFALDPKGILNPDKVVRLDPNI